MAMEGKMKRRGAGRRRRHGRPRLLTVPEIERGDVALLMDDLIAHPGTGPALTGGDVDADWRRASDSGEEAVGGTVATPDQDVVDEIAAALGVMQPADAEVTSAEEILRARDRLRWHLARDAADAEEGRGRRAHHPWA
jgi:Family of unknown function (DUF6335)